MDMMRTISVALLLALLSPLSAAPPASAGGGPTCRGREVTHVGAPGEDLTTTPGDDVVVTNGASDVTTLNGDDVICVTRSRFVYIVPGGDDDLVDATRFTGDTLETALGNIGVEGSSGDDIYLGGSQVDQVLVWSGSAGDRKEIHTDGGDDYLSIDHRYPGDVAAELGVGRDDAWVDHPRPGVVVDGEEGLDDFLTECIGCQVFNLQLASGAMEVEGDAAGRAINFEDADLINFGSRVVRAAVITGNAQANRISVIACYATGNGRGGDDDILVGALAHDGCRRITGIANGEAGDDSLTGIDGNDYLRGGVGDDGADGQAGRDLCRAEEKRSCER